MQLQASAQVQKPELVQLPEQAPHLQAVSLRHALPAVGGSQCCPPLLSAPVVLMHWQHDDPFRCRLIPARTRDWRNAFHPGCRGRFLRAGDDRVWAAHWRPRHHHYAVVHCRDCGPQSGGSPRSRSRRDGYRHRVVQVGGFRCCEVPQLRAHPVGGCRPDHGYCCRRHAAHDAGGGCAAGCCGRCRAHGRDPGRVRRYGHDVRMIPGAAGGHHHSGYCCLSPQAAGCCQTTMYADGSAARGLRQLQQSIPAPWVRVPVRRAVCLRQLAPAAAVS